MNTLRLLAIASASLALAAPAWAGCPGSQSCFEPHETTGCNIYSCCVTICVDDPFCCDWAWDGLCVEAALQLCSSAPPENDSCESAIPLPVGQWSFTTINATGSLTLPASCDEGYGLELKANVFFVYEATADGQAIIGTCGNADFDTRLAVYTNSCSGAELLACNDDAVFCGNFTSKVTIPIVCGQQYLVVVGSYDGQWGDAILSVNQLGWCTAQFPGVLAGPFVNPTNCREYLVLEPSTWTFARLAAESLGGTLVRIDDAQENAWIWNKMSPYNGLLWIGASDLNTEGTFVWTDGSPVVYSKWSAGEPNNYGGSENYVHLWSPGGQWNDAPDDGGGFVTDPSGVVELGGGFGSGMQVMSALRTLGTAATACSPGLPCAVDADSTQDFGVAPWSQSLVSTACTSQFLPHCVSASASQDSSLSPWRIEAAGDAVAVECGLGFPDEGGECVSTFHEEFLLDGFLRYDIEGVVSAGPVGGGQASFALWGPNGLVESAEVQAGMPAQTISLTGVLGPGLYTVSAEARAQGFLCPEQAAFDVTMRVYTCLGDIDLNGVVDGADLGALLGAWGTGDSPADFDGSGVVDGADLGTLLGAWGACPPVCG